MSALRSIALVLVLGTGSAEAGLPKENQKWLEARTPHFRVLSTASERETRDVAQQFEVYRAALLRALGGGNSAAAAAGLELPINVYLIGQDGLFKEYSSFKERPAYFLNGYDGAHIVMRAGGGQEAWGTIYHEYVHYHVKRVAPDLAYPLWVNEGLATCYGETHVEPTRVVFGTASPHALRELMERSRMRMRQLMSIGHGSEEYREGIEVPRFYASSWFVTYYLMIASPTRGRQLPEYLGRLRAGQPAEDAFQAAFKTTPEGLDQELDDYMKQFRLMLPMRYLPRSEIKVAEGLEIRPISYSEAVAQLGILSMSLQGSPARPAGEHFEAALAKQADAPTALLGKGLVAASGGQSRDAQTWLAKAWGASEDPRHRYLCLRTELMLGDQNPARLGELIRGLRASVEKGLGEPHVLVTATQQVASASGPAPAVLDDLAAIAARVPALPSVSFNTALALDRHGRSEQAAPLLQSVIQGPSAQMGRMARQLLEMRAKQKAYEAQRAKDDAARQVVAAATEDMDKGRLEEGLAKLREARLSGVSEGMAAHLDRCIAQFEEAKASRAQAAAKPKPAAKKKK